MDLNQLVDKSMEQIGTDDLNVGKRFLEACVRDLINLNLRPNVGNRITYRAQVSMPSEVDNLERFLSRNQLSDKAKQLSYSANGIKRYILDNVVEIEFTLAYLAMRGGSKAEIHSHHEPETGFPEKSQISLEISKAVLAGIVGGYIPAVISSYLSKLPEISSNLQVDLNQQGFSWGLGVVGASLATAGMAVKAALNTRKEDLRERPILGTEHRVKDKVTLNKVIGTIEDVDPEIEYPHLYKGRVATFRLYESSNGSNPNSLGARIAEWRERHPHRKLFAVSISNDPSGHTIGNAVLLIRTNDGVEIALKEYRRRHYGTKLAPAGFLNPELTGWSIPLIKTYTERSHSSFSLSNGG